MSDLEAAAAVPGNCHWMGGSSERAEEWAQGGRCLPDLRGRVVANPTTNFGLSEWGAGRHQSLGWLVVFVWGVSVAMCQARDVGGPVWGHLERAPGTERATGHARRTSSRRLCVSRCHPDHRGGHWLDRGLRGATQGGGHGPMVATGSWGREGRLANSDPRQWDAGLYRLCGDTRTSLERKGRYLCWGQHCGAIVDHQETERVQGRTTSPSGFGHERDAKRLHCAGWVVENFPQRGLGLRDQMHQGWVCQVPEPERVGWGWHPRAHRAGIARHGPVWFVFLVVGRSSRSPTHHAAEGATGQALGGSKFWFGLEPARGARVGSERQVGPGLRGGGQFLRSSSSRARSAEVGHGDNWMWCQRDPTGELPGVGQVQGGWRGRRGGSMSSELEQGSRVVRGQWMVEPHRGVCDHGVWGSPGSTPMCVDGWTGRDGPGVREGLLEQVSCGDTIGHCGPTRAVVGRFDLGKTSEVDSGVWSAAGSTFTSCGSTSGLEPGRASKGKCAWSHRAGPVASLSRWRPKFWSPVCVWPSRSGRLCATTQFWGGMDCSRAIGRRVGGGSRSLRRRFQEGLWRRLQSHWHQNGRDIADLGCNSGGMWQRRSIIQSRRHSWWPDRWELGKVAYLAEAVEAGRLRMGGPDPQSRRHYEVERESTRRGYVGGSLGWWTHVWGDWLESWWTQATMCSQAGRGGKPGEWPSWATLWWRHRWQGGRLAGGKFEWRQGREHGTSLRRNVGKVECLGWTARMGVYLHPKEDKIEKENKILAFLGYLGWLSFSSASLKQAVFALKDAHKRAGAGDPTEGLFRLWVLMNGLDRRAARKPRRLGVTPGMLQWIGKQFEEVPRGFGEERVDGLMVQAALVTAWFFMMRASEFCDSNGITLDNVMRGLDVKLSRDGQPALPGEATEVTVQFRKTKADQEAFGSCKTMAKTGVQYLCPVQALENYRKVCPGRFQGVDAHKPLFRWGNGTTLKRTEVQYLLQKAAVAEGLPANRFLSHSLRIGGASALFQASADIELVKRMGRWSSSAVQKYLYDGGQTLKELAGRMAQVDKKVHYTWFRDSFYSTVKVELAFPREETSLGGDWQLKSCHVRGGGSINSECATPPVKTLLWSCHA